MFSSPSGSETEASAYFGVATSVVVGGHAVAELLGCGGAEAGVAADSWTGAATSPVGPELGVFFKMVSNRFFSSVEQSAYGIDNLQS